ncbi:ABC transporter ATP-binding protein|uniref:ATP-binding cassette, subfamily B n=1 Tax=Dendrosporobacter quercicolus TaxID=146817 RepID=A0A1G9NEA9_9FIRM|nr:ABC transporter ATP-binding protein [Dendrosporobacter quercicolus]NSL47314.1 ABC transporter ATP-binding protein [Dendrosporobacter quercicolus DSM 1736]SDL84868.1 ATP-binding cassette, subfamily B [Dendrosporobacter quercicolus]
MDVQKKSLFAALLLFAGSYRTLLIWSWILAGLSSVLSIGPFLCIWLVIRELFGVLPDFSRAAGIVRFGWMAVGFALASIACYFASLLCSHFAAFRVEKNMRKAAIRAIMDAPLGYFNANASGKLRKIIDDNVGLTHAFLAHQLPDLAGAAVMPLAILAVFFTFDWRLGLVCLAPLLLSLVFLQRMMGGEQSHAMHQYLNALETMNTAAVEYVRSIPVVKVFQQTVHSFKDFRESINHYWQFASEFALTCRVPLIGFMITIHAPSLLLLPVGLLLIATAPDYKRFLLDLIFYMLFIPVGTTMMSKIMYVGESVMAAQEAVDRMDAVLRTQPLAAGRRSGALRHTGICFDQVTFAYPGKSEPALRKVSLTVPPGKTYALVGPSGGGKTTLASLVPRFWDVQAGSVKLGGVDVRDFPEAELLRQIAFVFQNTRLFKASLLDNIRAAKPEASRDEVLRAAHLAQCDDILAKLPQGLDTVVGRGGVYLSGGEQQRIALARAIVKDAPVIVLDEATAFADPENEHQIQRALTHLTQGKTVLVIAHRLSSVRQVDCIAVLQQGGIVESGTHEQLLSRQGVYAGMWQEYQTATSWKVGRRENHA